MALDEAALGLPLHLRELLRTCKGDGCDETLLFLVGEARNVVEIVVVVA